MAKKQADRLSIEKIKGKGPKEIFGENAQIHDKTVNVFSKAVEEMLPIMMDVSTTSLRVLGLTE
jgi:type II restriction enzyme